MYEYVRVLTEGSRLCMPINIAGRQQTDKLKRVERGLVRGLSAVIKAMYAVLVATENGRLGLTS